MTLLALRYMGDGEFRAIHPKLADRQLVCGEVLRWEPVDDRSDASHRHLFAIIAEAWQSLPEEMADELPNPEALRKYATIKAGYCHRQSIACANNGEALNLAAAIRRMEEFSIVEIAGKVVTIWSARTLKRKRGENGGMDKREFQACKDAILHVLAQLIGTDVSTLSKEAA
jgi:hypothetical protein